MAHPGSQKIFLRTKDKNDRTTHYETGRSILQDIRKGPPDLLVARTMSGTALSGAFIDNILSLGEAELEIDTKDFVERN